MKILIIDTYYQGFLDYFYKKQKTINLDYKTHKKLLVGQFFGTSGTYSHFLNKIGHITEEIVVNDEILQKKWAAENKIKINEYGLLKFVKNVPIIRVFVRRSEWIQIIAMEQIKKYQPDILYMQDLSILTPKTLEKIKKECKLLVGQIASPLPPDKYINKYDLILTSFPHFVKKIRKKGIKSEYFKIGFDPRILRKIGIQKKKYDVSFVGSFTPHHIKGTKMLERLCKSVPLNVWGRGVQYLSLFPHIKKYYKGEAWAMDMYKIFAESKIVINRHIDVAKNYANNMRLFEATGMGALLITDEKKNLETLFKVGSEIVDYENTESLIIKVKYYLKNENQRSKIAQRGQKKTLHIHSYKKRMLELSNILSKHVDNK